MEDGFPASQASSHFSLEPVPANILAELEISRRNAAALLGPWSTGCKDLDDHVLLSGGFERGTVVGVSAEDDQFGLDFALQTIAHNFFSTRDGGRPPPHILVITPLAPSAVIPDLRQALRAQALRRRLAAEDTNAAVKACLQKVDVARAFDFLGLWETLRDLDIPPASPALGDAPVPPELPREEEKTRTAEIPDSEDEGSRLGGSSPVSAASHRPAEHEAPPGPASLDEESNQRAGEPAANGVVPHSPRSPDMILVTSVAYQLRTLFEQRLSPDPYAACQVLGVQLRGLARSEGSLIMLLNSTNTPDPVAAAAQPRPAAPSAVAPSSPPKQRERTTAPSAPLDPTLRSIFAVGAAAAHPNAGLGGYGYGRRADGASSSTGPRRGGKPSFGLVFTQLLDLHLLCTRLERAAARGGTAAAVDGKDRRAWAVEALLDELGAWEAGRGAREGDGRGKADGVNGRRGCGALGARECRERRWTALDVSETVAPGCRVIVDAPEVAALRRG